ncbi:MAG TPA: STT3 domain-containing protein [Candidatus Bathyarchaeia archaeon]|nr:STT3 domain-containing protein [Candidatus Bathyarchaeia archaeon]
MKRWLALGIKETLKKRLINGLKGFGRLRLQINHAAIMSYSALLLILFIAFTIRVLPIRWEISSGTVRLSEFDPYYQFILTRKMVQDGLLSPYWPTPWINTQQWYPQGLNMGTSLPALPMTTAVLYNIITFLGVNVDLMTFASFMPAIIGAICSLIIYFVGKDMGGKPTGLLAALFLALAPSFLQRTSLGFFDTEVPGILGLLLFMFMFLRAIEENRPLNSSLKYTLGAAAALAYFITAWGAAYFILDLTVFFVFVLILLKRYSQRLLLSYSLTFGVALFVATKVPYISLGYLTSGPVIPVAGVFLLLCLSEVLRHKISARTKVLLIIASLAVLVGGFVVAWQLGYMENIAGKFLTVLDPFLRELNPLIESVAEHRISAWGNIYYELGIGILFFLAGLYFTLRNPTNRNVFLLLFGLTSLYFAASMVRLLVIFAPAFSLLVATGILGILKPFYTLLREAPHLAIKTKRGLTRISKEYSGIAIFLVFTLIVTNLAFSPQTGGMPRVYGQAYSPITISAGSLPVVPAEPVQEWLNMLSWTQNNLESTTVVCAWWDYGYWLSILGNVTTLADNATINNTQIENIGFIFMANETQSLKMLEKYNAKYILVFITLGIGQSSDQTYYVASSAGFGDEGKWMWMARISGEAQDRFIQGGFIDRNSSWIDETAFGSVSNQTNRWEWNDLGRNSTIYKLMSWAKQRWTDTQGGGYIYPDEAGVQPTYFKEAYFSGLDLTLSASANYGYLIPLVALYEIDWQKYYNATSPTS